MDETNNAKEFHMTSSSASSSLLHGALLPVLIRLAMPTVVVMLLITTLSVAETYFVSVLGVHAIAAASLVVPVVLLMTMVSNGGIGGGVSSAIARAKGAGHVQEAESLAWHALIVAIGFGLIFSGVIIGWGEVLYRFFGGEGESLAQALLYSKILFGGAVFSWVLMLMQAALRGTGNVKIPALIVAAGVVLGLLISPALISGWYGLPQFGLAGAGIAQVITNVVGVALITAYMRSKNSSLRLKKYPLNRQHFRAILGIGMLSSLNALMTNLALTLVSAAVGHFGLFAIAGYGIASRLDGLLIPIMFGFGTAVLTVVGTNIGAGNVLRAKKAALVNAGFVAGIVGLFGLLMAVQPQLWLQWFSQDPEVLKYGATYLHFVGPVYGFTAITLSLYFAGQGAGKIAWPLTATAFRFFAALCVALGVSQFDIAIDHVFAIVALSAIVACVISFTGFRKVAWG